MFRAIIVKYLLFDMLMHKSNRIMFFPLLFFYNINMV
jgi:hypothetical protein